MKKKNNLYIVGKRKLTRGFYIIERYSDGRENKDEINTLFFFDGENLTGCYQIDNDNYDWVYGIKPLQGEHWLKLEGL